MKLLNINSKVLIVIVLYLLYSILKVLNFFGCPIFEIAENGIYAYYFSIFFLLVIFILFGFYIFKAYYKKNNSEVKSTFITFFWILILFLIPSSIQLVKNKSELESYGQIQYGVLVKKRNSRGSCNFVYKFNTNKKTVFGSGNYTCSHLDKFKIGDTIVVLNCSKKNYNIFEVIELRAIEKGELKPIHTILTN